MPKPGGRIGITDKATKPADADAVTTATAPASRTTLPMASDSACC